MAPIYRYFGEGKDNLDFSDEAAWDAYMWETQGKGNFKLDLFSGKRYNGYVVGKRWMDITVKMWFEGFKEGTLEPIELYMDPELREFSWWLDGILQRRVIK